MKTSQTRVLLFSVIAMLSICLLGSTNHNNTTNKKSNVEQLKQLALDFSDIPLANHRAWQYAAAHNPQLLIRLSTTKLVRVER